MPLPSVTVDKYSPVPLYHQLRQALEGLIRDGTYQPGQYFPTEEELAQLFNVSRITVRQAIAEMLEDGLLYRQRPRGRLHVSPRRVHQHLTRLRGFFTDDVLTAGLEPRTDVLAVEMVRGERVAAHLGCAPDTRVFRIDRLHHGNAEPLALQTSYIPVAVCPDLDQHDLAQSLFRLIEETYRQPITRAVQHVRVREAMHYEVDRLRLAPHAYVLQVDRTSYAADGTAVEYYTCILRADRYDFTMELELQTEVADHGQGGAPITGSGP
jgi:GntR family transcriptional regulator